MMQAPIMVLNQNTKRESGRKVQMSNIDAAKTVADIIRTCLGPKAMLKMLMDPMGGIVMTNDGNAILREIQVQHPAAKTMLEISRTQDEEVGDGTTSVVILAGEVLSVAAQFIEDKIHPTVIIAAYRKALDDLLDVLKEQISVPVDVNNDEEMLNILKSCLGTKFMHSWSELACSMALKATRTCLTDKNGRREIDIKRYTKVEKIPGGMLEDSCVLDGIMLNKDVVHPRMSRRIENPRILLLDCNLEFKKGESMTNIEISQETDFNRILQLEEEFIKKLCDDIIVHKPNLLFTEKGVSDLAQHYLVKAGISVIRRIKKTDNNRIARAVGATIVNRPEEIKEEDLGLGCGLFEIQKIGDDYFTFLKKCKDPKACTILLRGASKDILNEVDRNLQDAMNVARNVMMDPRLCPGGGATEMALSHALEEKSKSITGVIQWPYKAIARALEIIPKTLIQNCGTNSIRTLTALRAKHAAGGNSSWGIDGDTGTIADMKVVGIWDCFSVKAQTYKTAIETSMLLLRIDDIVSGTKKSSESDQPQQPPPQQGED
ncbi:T-complex protein 1 subunit gamma isoform X2 [Hydra vulgaris]|uniref:T-complex protein 1 subunit gamma n=1 Tax=Hydra vulgaris TaxID=6087 RepID=A0ABM4DDC1_HYDVU